MLNPLLNPDEGRLATTPSPIKKDAVRTPDSTHSKSYLSGSVACQGLPRLMSFTEPLTNWGSISSIHHYTTYIGHLQPQTLIILKILAQHDFVNPQIKKKSPPAGSGRSFAQTLGK